MGEYVYAQRGWGDEKKLEITSAATMERTARTTIFRRGVQHAAIRSRYPAVASRLPFARRGFSAVAIENKTSEGYRRALLLGGIVGS